MQTSKASFVVKEAPSIIRYKSIRSVLKLTSPLLPLKLIVVILLIIQLDRPLKMKTAFLYDLIRWNIDD